MSTYDTAPALVGSWPKLTATIEPTTPLTVTLNYAGDTRTVSAATEASARGVILAEAAIQARTIARAIAVDVTDAVGTEHATLTLAVRPGGIVQERDEDGRIPAADALTPPEFPCVRCQALTTITGPCAACGTDAPFIDVTPVAPEGAIASLDDELTTLRAATRPEAAENAREDELETLFASAATATPEDHPRKRPMLPWLIGAGAAVLIVGAVATTTAILSGGGLDAIAESHNQAAETKPGPALASGYERETLWTLPVAPKAVTPSADGTAIGYVLGGQAVIVDARTGESLAAQELGAGSIGNIYRVGDLLVTADRDHAYFWNSDHATQKDQPAKWVAQDLEDDSLQIRGDAAILTREVGADYRIMQADLGTQTLTVPTAGAVPFAAEADAVLWATNKEQLYVTDRKGAVEHDVKLTPPEGGNIASKWLGGNSTVAYVLWANSDAQILTVHLVKTGEVLSQKTLPVDANTSVDTTQNGAYALIAGQIIDTKTGALVPLTETVTGTTANGFITLTDGDFTLTTGAAEPRDTTTFEAGVTPLGETADGTLIATFDGKLHALTTAPQSKK